MNNLKIYIHPLSQPARALMMFVRASAIPHKEVVVDLLKGEQHSDEYKKINPLEKVPVIDHNGFVLRESVAILRYLPRTFPIPDHWYPKDSKVQARVDEYLEWQHLNTRTYGTMYFAEQYIFPRMMKQPLNEKRAGNFLKGFKQVLDNMENVWLKDRPFIAGDKISVADLLAACEMEQTSLGDYNVRDHHPKIAEYMERVRSTISPHYDEVNTVINKAIQKIKVAPRNECVFAAASA